MSNSLSASTTGLAIVEKARKRRGWTKTSTARWWQEAHTSRATLRRFCQGDRIQRDIFIAICAAVGITNWEAIADVSDLDSDLISVDSSVPFNWSEAPDVESFYGRTQELEQLEQWILSDRCKCVTIVGITGIGKTALALALSDRIQGSFDGFIWRSLSLYSSLNALLDSLLTTLTETPLQDITQGINQLIQHLQNRRYFLVFDGFDAILNQPETTRFYHQFIQQLSQARHASCILITSRENLSTIELEAKKNPCLMLKGLAKLDAIALLQSRGFTGQELGIYALIRLYRGNPLALKLVTPLIHSIFAGNIAAFLNENTLVIGERLRAILKQQFAQLSDLEQDILYWLAIWQEPVSFCRLQTHFLISIDPAAILEAIVALETRSLLEKWLSDEQALLTLQPLVMKIVVDELVEQATQEIQQVAQNQEIQSFKVLRSHWLLRPGTDEIAGDPVINQLREKLWRIYGANLPQILVQFLQLLTNKTPLAVGYIGCNLTAILGKFPTEFRNFS